MDEKIYSSLVNNQYDQKVLNKLLELKQKMLVTNNVYFYDPYDKYESIVAIKLLSFIDDMKWAFVEVNGKNRIMIRVIKKDHIDLKELKKAATKDFENRDYHDAVNKRLEALANQETASMNDYYDIALCFYKMNNWALAYHYFTIAKSIALEFGLDDNIDKYLLRSDIRQRKSEDPTSIETKVNANVLELLIIDVIDNNDYLFDVLKNYCMTHEQQQVAILLLAKEYFRRGQIKKGDKLLLLVENADNKTKPVKDLLKYYQTNKSLFIKKNNK